MNSQPICDSQQLREGLHWHLMHQSVLGVSVPRVMRQVRSPRAE
jgi:hypothetical protein